jgi:invasion protein IalB
MAYEVSSAGSLRRTAGLVVAAGLGLAIAGSALAQQSAPGKKPAAPAAGGAPAAQPAAATPAKPQSAWVKLCEKAKIPKKGADGKDGFDEKSICLTHHERLDGNTGMVMVSAALRQVEGAEKQHLMIMVPLGMAIPPGVRAAVYPKELWEKVTKNEKIDEKALKPFDLKYTLCHPAGCTAEAEAPKEIVEQMRAGGGIMVLAMNAAAQPIAFLVPLEGFATTHAGAPVDSAVYSKARSQLMQQIAARREELIKQHMEQQKQQGGQAPTAAAAPAAAPAAKPAAPPAKKP